MILFLSILLAALTLVLALVTLMSVERPAVAAATASAVKWLVIMLVLGIVALTVVPLFA